MPGMLAPAGLTLRDERRVPVRLKLTVLSCTRVLDSTRRVWGAGTQA